MGEVLAGRWPDPVEMPEPEFLAWLLDVVERERRVRTVHLDVWLCAESGH